MPASFHQACIHYLTDLRALRGSALATDELSLRPALDSLLKQAANIFERPVQFIGEGKAVKEGRPDFTVTRSGLPIGYVEAEAYDVDLDHLTGHAKEQNDRFRANLDNFLLTNHLEFRLYVGGALVDSAKLPAPSDKGKVSVGDDAATKLATLLARFLRGQLPTIASPRDLAIHLARRTRQMHNEVLEALKAQSSDLKGNYEAFKEVLLPDLTEEQFADMYAQTIAYGLFAARCAAPCGTGVPPVRNLGQDAQATPRGTGVSPATTSKQDAQATVRLQFTRQSAADLVPKTNPFLRRLFQRIAEYDLDERVAWIADDTAQLLAQADIGEILADFGKRTGREDPVVHFYETFLAAYDPKLRELRGVYYTPEPVVSYIVRSIDHLLRTRFNKPMGLADENTLILDPATGTGSFLFAVVNLVRETVSKTIGGGAWSDYVEKRLLPRLFGFELLVAPYAVAHLKLGLLLQETGYDFKGDQRVGIYLTNTLEEAIKKSELLMGRFISDEANEAADIKRERPILVVLGNPPYSGHSANRSRDEKGKLTFIGELIEDYKLVDGKPLGEKNPKWLQDDYVKFIRFAQWRIDRTGEGVIGYITNHGYLDNPTFRGMRQHLMRTFNEIYVYNLHGNSKKKERTPDGGKDENVFDIQQGVAILLCVKQPVAGASRPRNANMGETPMPPCRVFHADLYGVREDKYNCLLETDMSTTSWTELQPSSPFYLFAPQNTELRAEYEQGWKVTEVFPVNVVGIVTARDALTIHWSREDVWQTVTDFAALPPEEARAKYDLGEDVRDWKVAWAQQDLRESRLSPNNVVPILYRPFDVRYTYYTGKSRGFHCMPRGEVMRHMLAGKNLGMIATRQTRDEWHVLTTNLIMGHKSMAAFDINTLFPLYLYPTEPTAQGTLADDANRRPNLSPAFIRAVEERLRVKVIYEGLGQDAVSDKLGQDAVSSKLGQDAQATRSGTGVSPVKSQEQSVPPVQPQGQEMEPQFLDPHQPIAKRAGAYLPHWSQEGATYFVTFRLADSLPQSVIEEWKEERQALLRIASQSGRPLTPAEERQLQRLFSEKVERYLDAGHGNCWMRRDDIAQIVTQALHHFNGQRYMLWAWCVMPNHVHVVVQPLGQHQLSDILHSWKSFIAKQINKRLNRQGVIWQPEYFDHLIRNAEDFERFIFYTASNPDEAGLMGWKWVGLRGMGVSPMEEQGQDVSATENLGQDAQATITPEDIFHYAYAVFHSPTYRARYAEFLKMDFPRLPLTSDLELFRDLAALGKQLVALHLLDTQAAPVLHNTTSLFEGEGNREVEKVRYVEPREHEAPAEPIGSAGASPSQSGRVYINKTQYFDNVPSEVWEFRIGGYQVCDKWLKDRQGRRLTIDDIQHYQRIVVALRETIQLMAEIDERILGFPLS